ncbi:MAG: hypothetical protein AB1509_01065 [Chloroflexota bacterium]|mgnify:CR=1 FL=1|nr:hypothetical protein [Betaproteobacteria bacterium PRO4]WKZ36201.1 MAG: hypothetical protein QY332_21575 [Anaerolineales bacterium]
MLYPDDSQIADFESAYNKAKTISSIGEQSLQVDADPYLGQIKGYDEYRAFNIIKSEEGIPNWNTNYGGHATTRFDYNAAPNTINLWRDILPMDNVFFGQTTCNQVKDLVENYGHWQSLYTIPVSCG